MSETTFKKQMNVKTVVGVERGMDKSAAAALLQKISKETPDCVAFSGDITGHGNKTTALGTSIFLTGQFFLKNLITGEVFETGKVYLPKDFAETCAAAFDNRKAESEGVTVTSVISIMPDSSTPTGYTFVCKPIKTPESVSRAAQLLEKLHAAPTVKALPSNAKKAS